MVSVIALALRAPMSNACDTEWLTGARACPNRSVVGPPGETEGEAPAPDAREEMALGVAAEIVGSHVNNASLVNVAWRDVSGVDEVAEPLGGIGVNLVVVCGHAGSFTRGQRTHFHLASDENVVDVAGTVPHGLQLSFVHLELVTDAASHD